MFLWADMEMSMRLIPLKRYMEISMYLAMRHMARYMEISMYLATCLLARYMEISMYFYMFIAGFAFHPRYLWNKSCSLGKNLPHDATFW